MDSPHKVLVMQSFHVMSSGVDTRSYYNIFFFLLYSTFHKLCCLKSSHTEIEMPTIHTHLQLGSCLSKDHSMTRTPYWHSCRMSYALWIGTSSQTKDNWDWNKVCDYRQITLLDTITHLCDNFIDISHEPPLNLEHGWVIISLALLKR